MNPQWSSQQQPQQRGWHQQAAQTSQQVPMATGYSGTGMGYGHGQQPQFQQPMQTGYPGRFGPSSSLGPAAMQPQATGYPGMMSQQQVGGNYAGQSMLGSFSAVPSAFTSTFMPGNNFGNSQFGAGAQQQTLQQQQQLPQYFQQHNQQVVGQGAVQVQWSLTADEKRNYDEIFQAWDAGSGYIDGGRALEVFQESGLERDDLMKIWALADRENRGKLNLAEFHVAMGLIYRRLSGNSIPDVLPAEMVPPATRDIDQSVDFLKSLLRNDTNARSTNLNEALGPEDKFAKSRTLQGASDTATRKDATVYKHKDDEIKGYKSSSRHVDRRNVRFQGGDDNADLDEIKRQLQDTQSMLERTHIEEDESNDLKQEIEDLKYRIRRVKDDIEYNKSGRRTEAKDEERRRLERELLFLMHEKLPELESKMRERNSVKRSEERAAARKRDTRNTNLRFQQEEDDSPQRETFDRYKSDRPRSPGRYGRDDRPSSSLPESDRYSSRDSPATSVSIRSPTRTPRAQSPARDKPAPAAPATAASFRPQSPAVAPISAEERQARIRAEAQRRVQERMRSLTGQAPSPSLASPATQNVIDTSVQERLEQDRRDAAARALAEDKAADERERVRQQRLEEDKQKRDVGSAASASAREPLASHTAPQPSLLSTNGSLTPSSSTSASSSISATKNGKKAPPPPTSRAATAALPILAPKKAAPPKAPPSRMVAQPAPAEVAPAAPIAATTPVETATTNGAPTRTNPFLRAGGTATPAASTGPSAISPTPSSSTNPFLRNMGLASATPTSPPAVFTAPASQIVQPQPTRPAATATLPKPVSEDDWGDNRKADDSSDDDSDDDAPGQNVKQKRAGLAGLLFGGSGADTGSAPTSRPGSAALKSPARAAFSATPVPAGPAGPPAAALPPLGAAAGSPPPRSALLGAIQAGKTLRKATTIDKSIVAGAGAVVGGTDDGVPAASSAHTAPVRTMTASPEASHHSEPDKVFAAKALNRQSVDWYSGLAADSHPSPSLAHAFQNPLTAMQEEDETEDEPHSASKEHFHDAHTSQPAARGDEEAVEDVFEMNESIQVRALYALEGQREQDLSFEENVLIIAHPAKDASSEWLYGMMPLNGKKGWVPKSYVETLPLHEASTVQYDYESQSEEELSIKVGEQLVVGEKVDEHWARVVLRGRVGLVPLSYLEA